MLTVLALVLIYFTVPRLVNWAIFDATWTVPTEVSANARRAILGLRAKAGACWLLVQRPLRQFIFGFYPQAERWRIDIFSFVLFAADLRAAVGAGDPER